jgi:hypothetical protein
MIIDTTPQELRPRDFRTVSAHPLTPYCEGYNDACYQHLYYNPYRPDTRENRDYNRGHEDGTRDRDLPASMGG